MTVNCTVSGPVVALQCMQFRWGTTLPALFQQSHEYKIVKEYPTPVGQTFREKVVSLQG